MLATKKKDEGWFSSHLTRVLMTISLKRTGCRFGKAIISMRESTSFEKATISSNTLIIKLTKHSLFRQEIREQVTCSYTRCLTIRKQLTGDIDWVRKKI